MASFFHGGSEAREASSSSSDLTLQNQYSLLMMNPLGHALLHAPPSLSVVPTTVDMPTCTPHLHHTINNNFCFSSPAVDSNAEPTCDIINPGPCGSHGPELLSLPANAGSCKKLSLSLSSLQPQTTIDHVEQGNSPVSTVTNGVVFRGGAGSFDPKYLRAAQELLDEIVSVGNANKSDCVVSKGKLKVKTEFSGDVFSGGYGRELTAAYRQELQMKKAKLVSMVEEVEHRYRQYREQMQRIVTSFEQAAGFGAAKSYTSLALQTVSKQFRCLKDAICLQIKIISKCLGEEYSVLGGKGELFRAPRTAGQGQFRHVGIMPHLHHHHSNAWRPQRGLPERAVSILRSWLFEHFLHPYPRDLDKQLLAKQTGLTRSQVSNWFINARVRLWKPMVEEMYLEEMKGQEITKDDNLSEEEDDELERSRQQPPSNVQLDILPDRPNLFDNNNNVSDQCSSSMVSTNCLAADSRQGIFSLHKKRNQQSDHEVVEASNLICFNNGGFENPYYHQAKVMNGNGVSLSLGLPHSRDQTFSNVQFGTGHQIEFSGISRPPSTYRNIDDSKTFVANAAAPLLPDFFA
ncbi:PREDICTED: BEL1-like homeodomain protein 5 isoform X2 [Tarenaya hassleriana]|uniref:BEL1-like homeodomain protein 5 isoform X2 n=1 Tax=Tarenaya hassleriana TaxID=28532 RepID=UPI00053C7A67|nr:PREDICTED: BEL1-like homeodomain protein 5 isoform X2 [Tarenaya hassleriana]